MSESMVGKDNDPTIPTRQDGYPAIIYAYLGLILPFDFLDRLSQCNIAVGQSTRGTSL
jgi:hypothetical protein